MLAWQHCLTHICQGHCNYLAEDIGHRKNVIRSKNVPSSSQLPGQRFLDKSRSVAWLEELILSCLGLNKISYQYTFVLVCSVCQLQIILVKVFFSCLHDKMSGYERMAYVIIWGVFLEYVFQKSLLNIWDQHHLTVGIRIQISISNSILLGELIKVQCTVFYVLWSKVEGILVYLEAEWVWCGKTGRLVENFCYWIAVRLVLDCGLTRLKTMSCGLPSSILHLKIVLVSTGFWVFDQSWNYLLPLKTVHCL